MKPLRKNATPEEVNEWMNENYPNKSGLDIEGFLGLIGSLLLWIVAIGFVGFVLGAVIIWAYKMWI